MEDRYTFAEKYGLNDSRVIDVSSCVSPLGPSRKVKAAIRRAVREIGREPDAGHAGLKRYFASRFGVQADSLCFANSLMELLGHIITAAGPRRVLIQGPALPFYEQAARAAGADVRYVHASAGDGFGMDAEGVISHLDGVDLIVMASPNRITGKTAGRGVIRDILSAAAVREIMVVLDESLAEFADEPDGLWEQPRGMNSIVLKTTAFFYGMPGMELAYAAASPQIAGAAGRMQASPPNGVSVAAALAAFRDAVYRKEVRDFVKQERKWMMHALRRLKNLTVLDSDTHLFLLGIGAGREEACRMLARAGFFIRDCRGIHGIDPAFLRCCLLKHEKNVRLIRLLKSGLQDMRVSD